MPHWHVQGFSQKPCTCGHKKEMHMRVGKQRRNDSAIKKDRKPILLFLTPAVLTLILLRFLPAIHSLAISFTNWNLYEPNSRHQWVGFRNYQSFLSDPQFGNSLNITFVMGFWSVLLTMLIGTALAFLMYRELCGHRIVQGFIISAMIIAPIVVGTCWRLMYNPGNGLINLLLAFFGMEGQPFLAQQNTVTGAIIAADVWQQSPYVMIIILAGLQGLPLETFEAAKIDGANSVQTLFRITLPLLKQSIMLALVIRIMDALRIFDIIFAMTKGGPGTASLNINLLMYLTGFNYYQLGKAAAMCIFILVLVTVPCAVIIRLFSRDK